MSDRFGTPALDNICMQLRDDVLEGFYRISTVYDTGSRPLEHTAIVARKGKTWMVRFHPGQQRDALLTYRDMEAQRS